AVRLINTTSAIPLRISKSAFENIIQTIEDSLASIATGKLFIQKSTPLKAKLTKENFRLSVGKIKPEYQSLAQLVQSIPTSKSGGSGVRTPQRPLFSRLGNFLPTRRTSDLAVRLINTTSAIPLRISKSAFENIIQIIEDSLASIATGK